MEISKRPKSGKKKELFFAFSLIESCKEFRLGPIEVHPLKPDQLCLTIFLSILLSIKRVKPLAHRPVFPASSVAPDPTFKHRAVRSLTGKQGLLHEPRDGFEQNFPGEGIACDESTGQRWVLSIERHCHRPMIGVQIP